MDIKLLPDEDLAVYVREVDLNSYREIVSRYEVRLLKYAFLMLQNELKAHEVVQEAFIECFKNINSFNSKSRFSVFLYRFTHQALKKELHKTHQELGTYEDIWEDFNSQDDVEHEFFDKDFLVHIKKYLHKLPVKEREVLVLHFILLKSYDEIVEILQLPLSSVSSRVGMAKTLIKRYAKN